MGSWAKRVTVTCLALGLSGCAGTVTAPPDAGPSGCVPGRVESCACLGGSAGVQVCLADRTYGACECPGTPDAASDVTDDADAPVDMPDGGDASDDVLDGSEVAAPDVADAAMDARADAAMDARADAAMDARADATTDSPDAARDAGSDAGVPGDVADAGATEQVLPWRDGACSLWTRVPPALTYSAASDGEGLWAVGQGLGVLMHRSGGRWRMAMNPGSASFAPGVGAQLLPVTRGVVWLSGASAYQRRDGRWADIRDASVFRGSYFAWAWGADVYAFSSDTTSAGERRLVRYDGTRWEEVTRLRTLLIHDAWGDRSAAYVAASDGLWRFDGSAWTGVATPRPASVLRVGGPSASEVYAAASDQLLRVDGGAASAVPDVDCGGPRPSYRQIASAPGRAMLVASCGRQDRAWSLVAGAWRPLGALPVQGGVITLQPDGQAWYSAPLGEVWSLSPTGWVSLEEQAAPPYAASGGILGTTIDDLLIAGRGLWRFTTDRWSVVPGSEAMDIGTAWRAPDGTLFFSVNRLDTTGGGTSLIVDLWRYTAGRLVRDLSLSSVTNAGVLTGRSLTEVYAFSQGAPDYVQHLYRWNGAAWSPATDPCSRLETMSLAPSGARRLVASCVRGGFSERVLESEGGAWSNAGLAGIASVGSYGPPGSLVAYAFPMDGNNGYQRAEAGWVPVMLPLTTRLFGPGPELTRLVGEFGRGAFGRVGASARASAWFTARTDLVWSDLRAVVGTTRVAYSPPTQPEPAIAGLFRCDLPP